MCWRSVAEVICDLVLIEVEGKCQFLVGTNTEMAQSILIKMIFLPFILLILLFFESTNFFFFLALSILDISQF